MIRRIISATGIAVSLAIFVATLVLWARSSAGPDGLVWDHTNRESGRHITIYLHCPNGKFEIQFETFVAPRAMLAESIWLKYNTWNHSWRFGWGDMIFFGGTLLPRYRLRGFEYDNHPFFWDWVNLKVPVTCIEVAVPLWFMATFFCIWPIVAIVRLVRQQPLPGHCRRCGYDLRATPERCPECGAVAELARKS